MASPKPNVPDLPPLFPPIAALRAGVVLVTFLIVTVLAMSLGGMVATAWAQRHPGEIERLVLINTSMRPFSRMHERLRPSAWPGLLGVAAHWRDAPRAESGIHRLTCNNVETLDADLEAWSEIRRSAPVSRGNCALATSLSVTMP